MELNRRNTQRAIIERTRNYVRTEAFQEITLIAVKERLKLVQGAYERLMEEHMRLIEGDVMPEDLNEQDEYIAEVEDIYLDVLERMQTKIAQMERPNPPAIVPVIQRNEPQGGHMNELRLEPMKLEMFSGNYRKWSEWRAMYDSLIHENERITQTQKFHYLKRSLTGSAERVLSGWQITGENYDQAYNTLINVFENNYRIIIAHLEELMQLEQSKYETIESMRKLIDTTNRVLRQLSVTNCPVDQWNHIMVYIVIARMAPKTLEVWETSQDLREMPLLENVLNFIERRSRGIINLQNSQPSTANNGANERNNSAKYTGTKPKTTNSSPSAKSFSLDCYNCKQPHPMHRCKRFENMSLSERRDRVRELSLCFNCFKPTHNSQSKSCQFGDCARCPGKRHNSLLCPKAVRNTGSVNVVQTNENNAASSLQTQAFSHQSQQPLSAAASMYVPLNHQQNFQ